MAMPIVYPIGHPLRSAYLKTHRENIHINALKRSVERGFKPGEYPSLKRP
jgi:hypothetical protein